MGLKVKLFEDLSRKASTAPLSELLPGVIRLAKALGEDDLLQWARLELDGYVTYDEPTEKDKSIVIPQYRFITVQFCDQWGRPILLGDPNLSFVNQYPLRSGVAVLEQMAYKSEEVHLRDEDSVELFREHFGIEVRTLAFSPMVVVGILSGIRMRLLEGLDAIEAKHPDLSRLEELKDSRNDRSLGGSQMSFTKSTQRLTAVVSGIAFLATLLALAIAVPEPTAFQYTVFRIVLALAASAFAATIPGFLEVTISGIARATGAIAVFLIVYFFSPAKAVTGSAGGDIKVGPRSPAPFEAVTEMPGVQARFIGTIVGGSGELTINLESIALSYPTAAQDGGGRYIPYYRALLVEPREGTFAALYQSEKLPVGKFLQPGQSLSLSPSSLKLPVPGLNSLASRWLVFEVGVALSEREVTPGTTYAHTARGLL